MKAHLAGRSHNSAASPCSDHLSSVRPLLICGATGTLGRAMARACALRNIPFILTSRAALDLTAAETVAAALDRIAPWVVVNAAGWVRVDEARSDERSVGNECVSPCRSRWVPYHSKRKIMT